MSNTIRPITISINALGGQGGGVLANWIIALAEAEGYLAQGTSVPGVAQRTGTTIYCVELFPKSAIPEGVEPVLSLMPVAGDVDIVLAAEWMEAGRAITRGFVTPDKTTLIASTHRDYAISEKSAVDEGRAKSEIVEQAVQTHAKANICFDMAACARQAHCAISAVLFGALAGSNALPFPRERYEDIIRSSGRSVDENLTGFELGFKHTIISSSHESPKSQHSPLLTALMREFPHQCHDMLMEGARRLVDYQDQRYVDEYIGHLRLVLKNDDQALGFALTREMAASLGRWMTYEDIIRIADLKTRRARFERISQEAQAKKGQIINTRDYLHPRIEEIRDIMPAFIGAWINRTAWVQRLLTRLFQKGSIINVHHISGYTALRIIAGLRPWRRRSFRHHQEMERMKHWCVQILEISQSNYALALEMAKAQAIVKGYGETHERSLTTFHLLLDQIDELKDDEKGAERFAILRTAASSAEDGTALKDLLEPKR